MSRRPTLREIQFMQQAYAPAGHPLRDKPQVKLPVPKKQTKRKSEEDGLQIQLVHWLKTQPRILFWATNPQVMTGEMTYQKMAFIEKLKAKGSRKGVPDLCALFRNRHGASTFCFIEVKKPTGGIVSDEQKAFMEAANERGAFTGVVRSLEELLAFLELAAY